MVTVSIEVMEVDKCIGHEEKSTFPALAFLLFEQRGQSARDTGIGAAPAGPITPIAVVRTRSSPHFGMPYNRDVGILIEGESMTFAENPALSWCDVPIPATDPGAGLSGMSVSGPLVEFDVELLVEFLANLFADYSAIVVAPAGNFWMQKSNEVFLRGRLVAV